jgi:uncharacterized 2Fe-2S/4Fe-4S cluster protein (DUF4445 family)
MKNRLEVEAGQNLADVLFERGVEFPCGGMSLCGGCRVRLLEGDVEITPEMQQVLSSEELRDGWRLACLAKASGRVVLDVAQWTPAILGDSAAVKVEAVAGTGVAVDLGTTTIVAQLVDLATGEVLAVRSGLNPQCRFGADLMTRIGFDLDNPGILTDLIRREIGGMVAAMGDPVETLICGNTVMHHLFLGISVEPLSAVPFETDRGGGVTTHAGAIGWTRGGTVSFLPSIGGFAGSDLLAGIESSGITERDEVEALIDLGTNGEIVIGSNKGIWCASTAAGPAFEAGRTRMGMRAATGAIDRVRSRHGTWECHVIGGVPARGICGSGLVDAASAGLDLGLIQPSGRFSNGAKQWDLEPAVTLYQSDIRELQLAKGAIVAGLQILAKRAGVAFEQIRRIHLAGAFGNYLDVPSARRIGLVPTAIGHVESAGNTALRGTRQLLLNPRTRQQRLRSFLSEATHVPLSADPEFQEIFAESMLLDAT